MEIKVILILSYRFLWTKNDIQIGTQKRAFVRKSPASARSFLLLFSLKV